MHARTSSGDRGNGKIDRLGFDGKRGADSNIGMHRGAQKSNSDDAVAGQTGLPQSRAVGRVTAVAVVTSNGNRVHTPLIAGPRHFSWLKKKPLNRPGLFDVSADTRA